MNLDRHMAEVAENDAIRGDEQLLLELLSACSPVRRGATWKCLCPVHAEKTPSCEVKRGRDGCWRWKCYGCGKGGDAFDLVVAVEGCTFRQARERLGARRAMPAPPPADTAPQRPQVPCTCARMWWELHEEQLLTGPRCKAHPRGRAPEPPVTHVLLCERRGCCSQLDVSLVTVAVLLDTGCVARTRSGELRWVCRTCVQLAGRQRAYYALWQLLNGRRCEAVHRSMTQEAAA